MSQSPAQKPSTGRAVHFHYGDVQCAADVTGVNADGTVSLFVKPPPNLHGEAGQYFTIDNVSQGDAAGCWSWPPRV